MILLSSKSLYFYAKNLLGILQERKQMIFQFEIVIIEFIIREGGVNH